MDSNFTIHQPPAEVRRVSSIKVGIRILDVTHNETCYHEVLARDKFSGCVRLIAALLPPEHK